VANTGVVYSIYFYQSVQHVVSMIQEFFEVSYKIFSLPHFSSLCLAVLLLFFYDESLFVV